MKASPWSKYFCASGLDVATDRVCPPRPVYRNTLDLDAPSGLVGSPITKLRPTATAAESAINIRMFLDRMVRPPFTVVSRLVSRAARQTLLACISSNATAIGDAPSLLLTERARQGRNRPLTVSPALPTYSNILLYRRTIRLQRTRCNRWLGRTSCKRKAQSQRCRVREHCGEQKQDKDVSVEVMDMHRINYGLDSHDQPMHDA